MNDKEKLKDAIDHVKRFGFKLDDKFPLSKFEDIKTFDYYYVKDRGVWIMCSLENSVVSLLILDHGETLITTSNSETKWSKIFYTSGYTYNEPIPGRFQPFPQEIFLETGNLTKGVR